MTSTNQSNIVCLVEDVSCFQLAVCRILSCLAFGINIRQEEGQFLQILILCVLCAVQKLCSSVVNTLVEKELLTEAGRLDVPGKPVAYATTPHFLRCFGLQSLDELPPLPVSAVPQEMVPESEESDDLAE